MNNPSDQQILEATFLDRIAEIENLTDNNVGEWLDDAIDIEVYLRCRDQETRFSHVDVLITYGGPNVRVRWDGGTSVTLDVTTMSGHASAQVECPALAEALEQYADLHV
jgi:hypothetical protein